MASQTILRLVYIHGFRGDHTSFQAFPTDLHEYLRSRLPKKFALESCMYPTYKSRKPIVEATRNFLQWLSTQPPGPVILLAHSMGGLLASEAATGSSAESKRIIGLVAFDVPYLGMHPHVIISGIASLFPKDNGKKMKTERELNDEDVLQIVHSDDVENGNEKSREALSHGASLDSPLRSPTSTGSQMHDEWEAHKASFSSSSRPEIKSQSSSTPPHSPSPTFSMRSLVSSFTNSSTTAVLSNLPPLPTSFADKLERAANKLTQKADSPLVLWLRKHSDDPLSAMTAWVVEHFEFGICMFDPAGLTSRYQLLERWDGRWVNVWTQTVATGKEEEAGEGEEKEGEEDGKEGVHPETDALPSNTADLAQFAEPDATPASERAQAKARKDAEKALRKQRAQERKRGGVRPARHFIVLPHARAAPADARPPLLHHFGSRDKWVGVTIKGVEDEVAAHCGLFIRSQNVDYDQLVERVGGIVEGWCQEL
ncbi:hypothetical protein DFH11DRAFT_979510 [Phellopilus nigrolimitatus]|nr:hypothetical protein DFH11DRAFT_979510 [Phellopilus nigrolimitatus]